jgi:hypothetical protein
MLQLDACAILALGNEAHFHFRFQIRSWRKSALICQESTSREGGFHESTQPKSKVLPSSPRSCQRPPTPGSISASTALALPMLCH